MHQTLFGIPFVFFFVVLALLLNRIPFLGKFFNIINTELHELGHALMALLFQGEVHKIEIFGDSSGVTTTRMKTRAGNILVALAGYPFASGMAFFSFYLLDKNLQTQYIIGLTLLFVMVCVLFVRNKYGWLWVIVFSAINIVLLHYASENVIDCVSLFYATTIMTESVASAVTLLVLSVKNPHQAGDAANLCKSTSIPAFFWSLLFVGFSIFICYMIYNDFFVIFAD